VSDVTVPAFFLDSFVATVPGTTSPVTEFGNGAAIALKWRSNGTSYTVYAAQDARPVYQGTAPAYVIPAGRTRNTTFILAAAVTGGPDSGTPNPAFETIYLYDALTVTIKNPDETPRSLTAGSMTVTGTAKLPADTTLGSATAGALTVTGQSDLKGGVTATGLTVTGKADLKGNTTLGSATVTGTLGVSGATTLAAATVGALTITSSVAMMAARTVSPGTWYTAGSDGLLIGTAWFPSDAGKKCAAHIGGWSNVIGWVWATGGNYVVHRDAWGSTMWGNANSFTVPVRKNTQFAAAVSQVDNRDVDAPTAFMWVPFGLSPTLTELSPDEATALGLTFPEPPASVTSAYDPSTAIAEVTEVIREIAGGSLPGELEQELSRALLSLVMHQP
jgi:hypothetical protein